ncbi:MAG: hypothetical protein JSS75_05975 [Bacteroidetes bacterium]|nr:hypothetical protein [Bacteroidota bacterium]
MQRIEMGSDDGIVIRIQCDPTDRAIFVQVFANDDEVAFAKYEINQFLTQLGMDGYIDAKVKIGMADKLRSKAAGLDADALKLENQAAELLCPYSAGEIVEVKGGDVKGKYEVCSIFLYHNSWAITAYPLTDCLKRKAGHSIRLSEKDGLRKDWGESESFHDIA